MPHAIFLHSSLTQGRIVVREPVQLRRLFRYEVVDVLIAMGVAGLINAAMLMMAAATFHRAGMHDVGTIEEAHRTLEPLLGSAASWIFAISLLASGLSSSSVGTMSGQIIMQGFLHHQIPVWIRRLVLWFGLPFAIIPLVLFTRRRDLMGVLVNRRLTTVLLSLIAALIVALNGYLLIQIFSGG
jgi:manganese transport protein